MRRLNRWPALALAALLLPLPQTGRAAETPAAEPACPVEGVPAGRGRVCVQLSIRQGRPHIEPAAAFVANGLPASITRAEVLSTLQGLFDGVAPVCDSTGSACVLPAGVPQSCLGAAFESSPWTEFWVQEQACGDEFSSGLAQVNGIFDRLGDHSPFELGAFDDAFDSDLGVLRLQVIALTAATPMHVIGPLKKGEREVALGTALAPLQGHLWDDAAIVAAIGRYYAPLRIAPKRVAPNRSTESIEVVEAERLQGIALPAMPDPADPARRRARLQTLYQLLDDRDFRLWLDKRAEGAVEVDGIEFARDLGHTPCEEPFWIDSRMRRPTMALSALGLALQPARVASRPDSDGCPEQSLVSAQVVAGDEAVPDKKPKPRFIGIELQYRPGQGSSVRGIYQQDMLALPQADLRGGIKLGRENDMGTGQVDLTADYIAFERLKHRLSFTLGAVDAATPKRFLEGALRDERRHGRQGRLMFEPFRERDGERLALTTGLQRSKIVTRDGVGTASRIDLTAWDVGADWHVESLDRLLPWSVRLQPSITRGHVLGTDASYRKAGVSGALHLDLKGNLALDLAARAEAASEATPVVEQPSLGGSESVRGFREDDGIGTRLWSVQTELWMPLPNAGKGMRGGYLDKVRIAPFIDMGSVHRPAPGAHAGLRRGVGLGLRLLLDPAVLKLDFAWRDGPSDTGGPRSRVHFSLSGDIEI